MRKMMKVVFIILQSLLIFIVIGAISTALVKNIYKTYLVEEFKSRGVYQEDISTDEIKYFLIEANEEVPAFKKSGSYILPGGPADILVSTQATVVNPLVSGFVSFFAGGHAAICLDQYNDYKLSVTDGKSLEATGLGTGQNLSSLFYRDYWDADKPFTEVIGLRAKLSEKERREVISLALSYLDDPYNFSFLFDTTNKSYCSDLVSKVYSHFGINLNKDSFTTSVYDLIVSNDIYFSYYHYYENGVKYIYYLG